MNELIEIKTENGKNLVSARELYSFLGLSKRFSAWFKVYVENDDYGFVENEDFTSVTSSTFVNNGAKRELQDYDITIEMAIYICRMSKRNPLAIKIIEFLQGVLGKTIEIKEQKRLEYQFGDMLDTITGFNWERQYAIEGGKYRLDFYLKDTLIIEYDEEHHDFQKEYDVERINYCRSWLASHDEEGNLIHDDGWRCPVIRVKKGEELEGLNRIIRHLVGFESFEEHFNYDLSCCDFGIK